MPCLRKLVHRAVLALATVTTACGGSETGGIPPDQDPRTTASGLQYSILTHGSPSDAPRVGDWVVVHFSEWLADGLLLNTSRLGKPIELMLGESIDGWNEALQLMTPGARLKLTVPPALGYGAQGQKAKHVPPNATLVYEIELVSFERGPEFRRPDPAKQQKTASGLVYEVLAPGTGAPVGADKIVELSFAVWNTSGRLLGYSGYQPSHPRARAGQFRWGVLREAPLLIPVGGRGVFEVPPELAYGEQGFGVLPPNSVTIWQVEVLGVAEPLPLPPFELPDAEELTNAETGLRYRVIAPGEGDPPGNGRLVKVHYAAWRTDGSVIASSYEDGEPLAFQVGQPGLRGKAWIPAWNQCIRLLRPGAIYLFVIPPQLAYGAEGRPPLVGPNETVVYYLARVE